MADITTILPTGLLAALSKIIVVIGIVAAMVLAVPTPAHADPDDVDGYIAVRNHEGIDTTARASVVHTGREVCQSFDQGITLHPILSAVMTSGGYTKDEAEWIVAAAVTKLCPNHKGDVH
jgi:hypothetical protein